MPKVVFRCVRSAGGVPVLLPADPVAENLVRRIKDGELVIAEIKRSRNIQHHRKFMALLRLVVDNSSEYTGFADPVGILMTEIKIGVHLYQEYRIAGTDQAVVVPDSIAVERMGQEEFEQFYDRAVDWILANKLRGLSKTRLLAEVKDLIDPIARGRCAPPPEDTV